MNVVKLRAEGNAACIVSSLRRLADDLEAGREAAPETLVCVADDQPQAVRMWVWGREVPRSHLAGILFGAAMMPVMPA